MRTNPYSRTNAINPTNSILSNSHRLDLCWHHLEAIRYYHHGMHEACSNLWRSLLEPQTTTPDNRAILQIFKTLLKYAASCAAVANCTQHLGSADVLCQDNIAAGNVAASTQRTNDCYAAHAMLATDFGVMPLAESNAFPLPHVSHLDMLLVVTFRQT